MFCLVLNMFDSKWNSVSTDTCVILNNFSSEKCIRIEWISSFFDIINDCTFSTENWVDFRFTKFVLIVFFVSICIGIFGFLLRIINGKQLAKITHYTLKEKAIWKSWKTIHGYYIMQFYCYSYEKKYFVDTVQSFDSNEKANVQFISYQCV